MQEFVHLAAESAAAFKIEDPRGHAPEVLERLRLAIASGAPAVPEARRPGFFEIQFGDEVFYIHVSPATARITMLATWSCAPEFPELEIVQPA